MDRNILKWIHFPRENFFRGTCPHYFLKEQAEVENRNKGDPIRCWQVNTLVGARVSTKPYQPESVAAIISSRHLRHPAADRNAVLQIEIGMEAG